MGARFSSNTVLPCKIRTRTVCWNEVAYVYNVTCLRAGAGKATGRAYVATVWSLSPMASTWTSASNGWPLLLTVTCTGNHSPSL